MAFFIVVAVAIVAQATFVWPLFGSEALIFFGCHTLRPVNTECFLLQMCLIELTWLEQGLS